MNASGRCIKVVDRVGVEPLATPRDPTPAIAGMEFICKNSSIPYEQYFIVKANAKLYSIDGVNRKVGYVAIDSDSGGYPYPSSSVRSAKLFSQSELTQFVESSGYYLSSGYQVIELNF